MSDTFSRSLEACAHLHDFLTLYIDHRERGEVRELSWYLTRFPGDDAGLAREYLALSEAGESPTDALFAGRYEVIRELGRGGQGVVSLARDTLLDRFVALKTIQLLGHRLDRLRREAEIASSLDHPDICPIYEANFDHVPAYVAMRYVEGESLSRLIAARKEPRSQGVPDPGTLPLLPGTSDETQGILRMVERVARALHAAHERGVIHRDIKPGNLLITPAGDPVLVDFGLARQEETDALTLTFTGEALGTPAYMSPEQIVGQSDLGRTTDVYALGVTLYECLTLSQPFNGPSRSSVESSVLNRTPPRPSSLNRVLPREIDAVIAVALDRDPARRYATAELFADDLHRVQAREPILAAPPGAVRRSARWIQRNPRVAAALVLLSLLLGLSLSLFRTARQRGEERLVELLTREAAEQAASAPSYAYAVALEAYRRSPNTQATNDALLRTMMTYRGLVDLGGFRRYSVDWVGDTVVMGRGSDVVVFDPSSWTVRETIPLASGAERLRLSPDETRLLIGEESGRIVLWDLPGQREIMHRAPGAAAITLLLCRWETGQVLSGDIEGRLVRWSLEGDQPVTEIHVFSAPVSRKSFLSRDNDRLVTFAKFDALRVGLSNGFVHVWDTADGRLVQRLGEGDADLWCNAAALSPDGAWLASAHDDGSARVWNLEQGVCVATLRHPGKVLDVDFSPDGETLVTSCDPGDLAIASGDSAFGWSWKTAPDDPLFTLPQIGSRSTYAIAYSPAGDTIATASLHGDVILWDANTAEEIDRCQTGFGIDNVLWSGDSTSLLLLSASRRFYWALDHEAPRRLFGHQGPVLWATFSPDGARALTASADGFAKVWSIAETRCLITLAHDDVVRWAEFSPNGKAILTGCDDGSARLWRGAELVATITPPEGAVTHGRFLDGQRIVTAMDNGELCLWNSAGELLRRWRGHVGPIQQIRVEPRRAIVASAGSDGSTRVWSPALNERLMTVDEWDAGSAIAKRTRIFDLTFSADGDTLVTVGEDHAVRRISLVDGSVSQQSSSDFLGKVAFLSPDRLVASHKWNSTVSHWSEDAHHPLGWEAVHSSLITDLAVSPQGYVLTTSADGTALLQRLEGDALVPHLRFGGHDRHVTHGSFSPDGQLVITASLDGSVWIWPVRPEQSGLRPRELTELERARLGL